MTTTRAIRFFVVAGSALLATAASASAVETSDFYFSASSGPQWRATASDSAGTTTFKTGFVASGALGCRFGSHRVEGEYVYFANNCDTTDPAGPAIGREPSSGDADGNAWMANYHFDFPPLRERFRPFLGGGFGVYRLSINGLTTPSLRTLPPAWGGPVVVYAKSTWTSAYQLRCGASYRLTDRADLLVAYRYFVGSDTDINLVDGSTIHPNAKFQGVELLIHVWF